MLLYLILQDINNIQRNKSQQQLLEEATLKLQREKEDILRQNEVKVKDLEQQNKVLTEQLEHFHTEKNKFPSQTPLKEGKKEDDKTIKVIFLYKYLINKKNCVFVFHTFYNIILYQIILYNTNKLIF